MADDVKTVGVKWEVDFKQLTNAEKAQQKYTTQLKSTENALASVSEQSKKLAAFADRLSASVSREALQQERLAAFAERLSTSLAEQTQAQEQATQATAAAEDELGQHIVTAEKSVEVTKKNTEEQKKQEDAVKKNSIAWGKGIKRLALYAIGAASVFRVIQKLRREFNENVEIIFKNTVEYQKMKEAQDDLKAGVLALLGTEESFKRYFESVTEGIERLVRGMIKLRALMETMREIPTAAGELGGAVGARLREMLEMGEGLPGAGELGGIIAEQLTGLDEFWDTYNQKVEEGTQRVEEWGDKITEARVSGEDDINKLTDAQKRYQRLLEQLVRAEEQRIEALIDLYSDYERKLEDIIETTNRAIADLALEGTRRREDIELTFQRRIEDIERNAREARARNEERLRLKLLRIEMRYRERLIRIQEDFDDSMFDAISKRDATAALMAIRRRDREQARALRERNNAIALAQAEFNAQIREQRRALERMREDAEIARRRALEDLAIHLERERQDIETNHDREMEDLEEFLRRRRADIEQDYDWQIARAQAHYALDEQEYAQHLQRRLDELQDYYLQVVAMNNTYAGMIADPLGMPVGGLTPTTGMQPDVGFPQTPVVQVAPQITITQPVLPSQDVSVSGDVRHQISGSIGAAMDGFEGRLGAAVTDAVIRVMGEVLQ